MHIARRFVSTPSGIFSHVQRSTTRFFRHRPHIYQRRFKATESGLGQSSQSASPKNPGPKVYSIPGAAWLAKPLGPLAYPLGFYNRSQRSRPYLTQFLTSLIIYTLGDLSSQFIQRDTTSPTSKPDTLANNTTSPPTSDTEHSFWQIYDPTRSLRALCIGGIISLPSYHWFLYLSSLFPQTRHIPRLILQISINQIFFAPFINTYFFSMQSLLASVFDPAARKAQEEAGGRINSAVRRVHDTLPDSWWNSCKFWPLVTAFSFTFVQPTSRSAFAGIVAVGWQTYLSLLNQRAIRKEMDERAATMRAAIATI